MICKLIESLNYSCKSQIFISREIIRGTKITDLLNNENHRLPLLFRDKGSTQLLLHYTHNIFIYFRSRYAYFERSWCNSKSFFTLTLCFWQCCVTPTYSYLLHFTLTYLHLLPLFERASYNIIIYHSLWSCTILFNTRQSTTYCTRFSIQFHTTSTYIIMYRTTVDKDITGCLASRCWKKCR